MILGPKISTQIPSRFAAEIPYDASPFEVIKAVVSRLSPTMINSASRELEVKAEEMAITGDFWSLAESIRDTMLIERLTTARDFDDWDSGDIDLASIKARICRISTFDSTKKALLLCYDADFNDMCQRMIGVDNISVTGTGSRDRSFLQLSNIEFQNQKNARGLAEARQPFPSNNKQRREQTRSQKKDINTTVCTWDCCKGLQQHFIVDCPNSNRNKGGWERRRWERRKSKEAGRGNKPKTWGKGKWKNKRDEREKGEKKGRESGEQRSTSQQLPSSQGAQPHGLAREQGSPQYMYPPPPHMYPFHYFDQYPPSPFSPRMDRSQPDRSQTRSELGPMDATPYASTQQQQQERR